MKFMPVRLEAWIKRTNKIDQEETGIWIDTDTEEIELLSVICQCSFHLVETIILFFVVAAPVSILTGVIFSPHSCRHALPLLFLVRAIPTGAK